MPEDNEEVDVQPASTAGGEALAKELEEVRGAEKSVDEQVADLARKLAENAGVSMMSEPLKLDDAQQNHIRERLGDPQEVLAAALKTVQGRVSSDAFPVRLDQEAAVKVTSGRAKRGEVVPLLKTTDQRDAVNADRLGIRAAVAERDRANALKAAANLLGVTRDRDLSSYLGRAELKVYNSPHNGAPTVETRTTELPGGKIIEMRALGVGGGDVLDTQVALVRG